jgi:hypothetical protein
MKRPAFVQRGIAAAASLTGRRFGLLVASSLVATSAIVASALTNPSGIGPLAALLGRSLASNNTPVESSPDPGPSLFPAGHSKSPRPSSEPATQTGGPSASPAPATSPEAGGPSEPETPTTPPTPTPPTPEAGRIKHVFVVSLASSGYESAFGAAAASQMPYLSATLRPQGELLSGYSLLSDAALANGVAAVSGQPPNPSTEQNCPAFSEFASPSLDKQGVVSGAGCLYPVEALTIADQLSSARFHWRAYMEGMTDETGKPHNCVHPEPGGPDQPTADGYAAHQNPFVYFHSLLDLGDCAVNDVPLEELQHDLRKTESTANYSFVAPDLCDAGVAGQCPAGAPAGAAAADAFLSTWVPKILASPAYEKDGLLVISFGELNPPEAEATAPPATASKKVGALLVSPFVAPGSTDAASYNPYSLLRSTEDLFGLAHLGKAGGAKVRSFAPALLGENGGD